MHGLLVDLTRTRYSKLWVCRKGGKGDWGDARARWWKGHGGSGVVRVFVRRVKGCAGVRGRRIFGGIAGSGLRFGFGNDLVRFYAVALLEDRKYSTLAPFGDFAFIAAWASLLF
ncbi:hypothetical protein RND71_018409 [Anisodus tanguticus]|uniref:Uncharacterized protein n=1 Tax=Anisodus tanguticus TaxID=243964 RepID=A0AAE1S5M9_9SOLA|nr:hypothetical protein RND71_018409 [Anisodus tanguticus]